MQFDAYGGAVSVAHGTTLRSANNGRTWRKVGRMQTDLPTAVGFATSRVGMAYAGYAAGVLYRTTNGSGKWEPIPA